MRGVRKVQATSSERDLKNSTIHTVIDPPPQEKSCPSVASRNKVPYGSLNSITYPARAIQRRSTSHATKKRVKHHRESLTQVTCADLRGFAIIFPVPVSIYARR